MGPARRSVLAALRFLGGLSVPLLLLCPPAAQGDCSLPPEVPNAHPTLSDRDLKSFPEGTTVTYKCNEGFVKVPGKPDSVICLSNNQWSEVAAFCNRSCDVPPRLRFASLKRSFSKQNYFPEGFVVEYDCRPGYRRNQTLSDKLTCLQNFTWSIPDEFCKKKSCPTPGDITHGHVSITTDISYGASISFSCDTGYRLVGSASSYCSLVDQAVEWSDPLPKCEEIVCPEPQEISNGIIQNPRKTYVYQQSVKYQCNPGFTLIGENSIYCTVKDDQGEWSGLPPECKENSQISKGMPTVQKPSMASVPSTKVPSAPQKTTTVNVPGTKAPSPPHKATTVNVPGTEAPSTPHKPTTVNVPGTGAPSTSQTPTTTNVPATKSPSTPQKPDTINSSATEALPTPQKPSIVNVSATKAPSTSQKPNTLSSSAMEALPTPQKPNKINSSTTKSQPTPQKPTTANDSATAKKFPVSNAVSTETPPAAQKPIVANASATQAIPATRRSTTAKISFTQSVPATQKSTAVHAPVTKGFHTTKRLTSAHITAKQTSAVVPRATTHFRSTSSHKGRGTPSSDANIAAIGKFGSSAVKRNCRHCGMYNPYSWKRILSFKCLRNTIKMQCLRVSKRKQVNAFYRRIWWTPLGTRYVPKYSQPCSCSKVVLGQLQIMWPVNQVLLNAYCLNASSS
ncbi:complement decay-accelerating factor isoform X4 [Herpailurus yagouaroundi]|uniref:complement decay-accelerating factor isoform X4 n=1 Tax=Herpailurus yagouaroundi TaxID=1608482 RepID=UPI001AD7177E|nr:complement decay-accelerating factor isoform X4 [Puma yagouaroundi]